jgi:hypothetical protein
MPCADVREVRNSVGVVLAQMFHVAFASGVGDSASLCIHSETAVPWNERCVHLRER